MSDEHPLLEVALDGNLRTPLSAQIVDAVIGLIAEGTVRPFTPLPTPSVASEALGVSARTVRAAYQRLATKGLITLDRGQPPRVISDRPARRAPGERPSSLGTVGVIMPSRRLFYGPLLDGIHTAGGGATLAWVCDARDDPGRALRYVRNLTDAGAGGIVAVSHSLPDGYGTAMTHHGPPIVFVDWPGGPEPHVVFDRREAAVEATRHLIDHGHRRIALVTPDPRRQPGADIREGHRAALKQAHIDPDPTLEFDVPAYTYAAGRRAGEKVLATDATAVFVGADTIAAGVHSTFTEAGIAIGRELAMAGLGDLEIGTLITPQLTTVALPRFQAGRAAMEMLTSLVAGERPRSMSLTGHLVVRHSCGCDD